MSGPLGPRVTEALAYAAAVHGGQTRSGTAAPYLAHLLAVAAATLEDAGRTGAIDEDEAVAALLHDAAEDGGGRPRLADIRARFGDRVAEIVEALSDSLDPDPPPWRERKEAYLRELEEERRPSVLRLSLADKLDNARAILRDLRRYGPTVWQRFNTDDPHEHLWYYRSLLDVYRRRTDGWLVDELERVLRVLEEEVGPPAAATV
jgi:(p)ppGpp synthase/HD superfamily hydrolase